MPTQAPTKTPTKSPPKRWERRPEGEPSPERHYQPDTLCPSQKRDAGHRTRP